jgi:hypothetical protein
MYVEADSAAKQNNIYEFRIKSLGITNTGTDRNVEIICSKYRGNLL